MRLARTRLWSNGGWRSCGSVLAVQASGTVCRTSHCSPRSRRQPGGPIPERVLWEGWRSPEKRRGGGKCARIDNVCLALPCIVLDTTHSPLQRGVAHYFYLHHSLLLVRYSRSDEVNVQYRTSNVVGRHPSAAPSFPLRHMVKAEGCRDAGLSTFEMRPASPVVVYSQKANPTVNLLMLGRRSYSAYA